MAEQDPEQIPATWLEFAWRTRWLVWWLVLLVAWTFAHPGDLIHMELAK